MAAMEINKKIALSGLLFLLIIIIGGWYFYSTEELVEEPLPLGEAEEEIIAPEQTVQRNRAVGTSVQGRIIESYAFGEGEGTILFVGGVHGGYEWNSTLLAYEFIDALERDEIKIPSNLKIEVVPNLNPDGLYEVTKLVGKFTATDIPESDAHTTGAGRFNSNDVDLNRNFDCKWKPESTWRGKTVSAGEKAFSEPEAVALRDFVLKEKPVAVIFWHSQAGAVYGSECEEGILPGTIQLMNAYATAASYKSVPKFDAYPITGDMEGWLASIKIPAVTVEMETRTSSEWERNKKGIEAVLKLYAK
jgi:predicted deacylase